MIGVLVLVLGSFLEVQFPGKDNIDDALKQNCWNLTYLNRLSYYLTIRLFGVASKARRRRASIRVRQPSVFCSFTQSTTDQWRLPLLECPASI